MPAAYIPLSQSLEATMRRDRSLIVGSFLVLLAVSTSASAQSGRIRPTPRAWGIVGDGIGVNSGGGDLAAGSLWQLFRAAGVLAITRSHGVEVSAMRSQELVPVRQRLVNPQTSVFGDGVFLSYATFDRDRFGGIPSTLSIGPGAIRRPPLDPGGPNRDTWAAQVGIEGTLYEPPVQWTDLSVGLRVLVMPGSPGHTAALLTLSFAIRAG
jgi:hypothetical protein